MIHAVFFDLGNVVCAFDPERRLRALAQRTGLERGRIQDAIWTSGLDHRAEAGELSPAEIERLLLDALEDRINAVSLRAAWSAAFVIDSSVCDLVASVRRPTFAFTNNGPMFSDCLGHELSQITRLFDRVICSWQLRARKPDPIAFERLCREVQQRPEQMLFVDDSRDNVEAARSVGFNAVSFTSTERLAEDLARLWLLPSREHGSTPTEVS